MWLVDIAQIFEQVPFLSNVPDAGEVLHLDRCPGEEDAIGCLEEFATCPEPLGSVDVDEDGAVGAHPVEGRHHVHVVPAHRVEAVLGDRFPAVVEGPVDEVAIP
eukprot:8989459-Pyramimonas_sp.AAC.1